MQQNENTALSGELTIVSAFYDIGRGDIKGAERDCEKYFEYFSFWAGLKNELVVFTSSEFAEKIRLVRANLGLGEKTKVVVKELESFDKEALGKMREVLANFDQSKGRKHPQNIECVSAEYDYVTYCKPFFVCEAINLGLTSDKVLWLDFGFNHGGSFFTDKNEFNFTLQAQDYAGFDESRMNLFALKDKEEAHLAEIYYSMEVFLIAGIIYGAHEAWGKFRQNLSEALRVFLSLQIIDDEQVLFVWCVRNYPQNYHIVKTPDWFESLSFFIPPQIRQNLSHKPPKPHKKYKKYKKYKKQMKEYFKEKHYAKAFVCALKYILAKVCD